MFHEIMLRVTFGGGGGKQTPHGTERIKYVGDVTKMFSNRRWKSSHRHRVCNSYIYIYNWTRTLFIISYSVCHHVAHVFPFDSRFFSPTINNSRRPIVGSIASLPCRVYVTSINRVARAMYLLQNINGCYTRIIYLDAYHIYIVRTKCSRGLCILFILYDGREQSLLRFARTRVPRWKSVSPPRPPPVILYRILSNACSAYSYHRRRKFH